MLTLPRTVHDSVADSAATTLTVEGLIREIPDGPTEREREGGERGRRERGRERGGKGRERGERERGGREREREENRKSMTESKISMLKAGKCKIKA